MKPPVKPQARPLIKAGPGRPRKPTAPRTARQVDLAEALEKAEARLDKALLAYAKSGTVKVELAMAQAELGVAGAWASYLRAQGLHTNAVKYSEQQARLLSKIAGLRELLATDQLAALIAKRGKEDALGKGARV